MFKQDKFKVLYALLEDGASVWKDEVVKTMSLNKVGIETVVTENDADMIVDNTSVFVREFTGMFDKAGMELYGGDIVKFPVQDSENTTKETLGSISWINGAFCIALEGEENIVYLSQQNVRQMEKVGNIYQHKALLDEVNPIDESVFEKKDAENNEEKE